MIVLDLECTCDNKNNFTMETIEIGSRYVDAICDGSYEKYGIYPSFQSFIKPYNSILTEFCKELTHIKQEDIDNAESFITVYKKFREFCTPLGDRGLIMASWGNFDRKQLKRDCELYKIDIGFKYHINLKQLVSMVLNKKQVGLQECMENLGLKFEGIPHRGLTDTDNIISTVGHVMKEPLHTQSFLNNVITNYKQCFHLV